MSENSPSEFNVITQWVIFIVLLFFIGFSIANAVYYGRSRNNKEPNPPISHNTATVMMVLNIIIAVLATAFAIVVMVSIAKKYRVKNKRPMSVEMQTYTPYNPAPVRLNSYSPSTITRTSSTLSRTSSPGTSTLTTTSQNPLLV